MPTNAYLIDTMIPKIIHYTWFGPDPYPPIVKKCIQSWQEKLPDYEIKLWNADNFDMNINEWVRQAYNMKKYAFASDFARFYLLYTYGGIYLDSDIGILQSLDPLLKNKAFLSFLPDADAKGLEAEIIGAEPGLVIFLELMEYYKGRSFINEEGIPDTRSLNFIIYDLFVANGLKPALGEQTICNVHIYPPGYFLWSGDDYRRNLLSENAFSVHYAQYSWQTDLEGFKKVQKILSQYYNRYEKEIWDGFDLLHLSSAFQKFRDLYHRYY